VTILIAVIAGGSEDESKVDCRYSNDSSASKMPEQFSKLFITATSVTIEGREI
jgi:hypothetical protein